MVGVIGCADHVAPPGIKHLAVAPIWLLRSAESLHWAEAVLEILHTQLVLPYLHFLLGHLL